MNLEEFELIRKSKDYISKGLTGACISYLYTNIEFAYSRSEDFYKLKEIHEKLILISGSFNLLKRQELDGIQDSNSYTIGISKINKNLLNILNDLNDPEVIDLLNMRQHSMNNGLDTIIEDLNSDEIEITINKDFNEYSDEDQAILLKTIAGLLNLTGSEIKIKRKRAGSTKITLQLSKEDTEKLEKLIEEGALKELNVVNARKDERNTFVKSIHEIHFNALYLYAVGLSKRFGFDISLADDLMQDFYLEILKNTDLIKEGYAINGVSYLVKVIQNNMFDRRRREESIKRIEKIAAELEGITGRAGYTLTQEDLINEFKAILNEKFNKEEAIIYELYISGYSYKEIGEILKMNPSTIGTKIFRIRKFLRSYLE